MSLNISMQKQWKGFTLDVSFRTDGELMGILGASGCGKSMTLKCIAGIETPDSGVIQAGGRTLFDGGKRINLRPQQRKVGYLFQSYALFPNMRVEENIGCGLTCTARGEKARRVAELIRRFRLAGLEGRYPAQLSGGQQQRVALARIFASEPSVLLLDEPFSALDAYLKEQLQMELPELLQGYGGDVVMVTHSRDEVYRLCKRLLVMEQGRCIACGLTKELFRSPGLLTVARLTGCKNISRARITGPDAVFAEDWGLPFQVTGPIPEGTDHIGIRAHHFRPGSAGPNPFPISIRKELENPFEWNVLFDAGKNAGEQQVWWQVSKEAYRGSPDYLSVDPEHILLLRSHT